MPKRRDSGDALHVSPLDRRVSNSQPAEIHQREVAAQGAKAAAGGQTPAAARALARRELKEFKKGIDEGKGEVNVTAPRTVQYELGQDVDMLHWRSGGLAAASLVATGVTCVELFAVSPLFIIQSRGAYYETVNGHHGGGRLPLSRSSHGHVRYR